MLEDLAALLIKDLNPAEALHAKLAFWQLWKQGWVKPAQYLPDLAYAILKVLHNLEPAQQNLALDTLRRFPVTNPYLNEPICVKWLAERDPLLETLIAEKKFQAPITSPMLTTLFSLKFEHAPPFRLFDGESPFYSHQPEIRAKTLIRALYDIDQQIVMAAKKTILALSLTDLEVLIRHCPPEHQNARLAQLLVEADYIPPAPLHLNVLTTLYARQVEKIWRIRPPALEVVLEASQSEDSTLAETARRGLNGLQRLDTQQALCSRLLRDHWPVAEQIAVRHGWLPVAPHEKILFYFVSGQWDKYEALDWDGRQLRAIYETSEVAFRQRLVEVIRQSGRPEYLAIITGGESRVWVGQLEAAEASVLVQILAANRAWARLWELVLELPLQWSVEAVKILQTANWQPTASAEAALLDQLAALANRITLTTETQVASRLALHQPEALFKVGGRVNDLTFAPHAPHLAIATGVGQVVVWNYAEGRREQLLRGLAHSAGQAVYLPNGTLAVGEKTSSADTLCALQLWNDGRPKRLGEHRGSILGLTAIGDQLVSFGRDRQMVVWDKKGEVSRHMIGDWSQAIAVSADQSYLAVIRKTIRLIPWPLQSKIVADIFHLPASSASLAFSPNGLRLWYGQHGQLQAVPVEKNTLNFQKQVCWPVANSNISHLTPLPLASLMVGVDKLGGLSLWDATNHILLDRFPLREEPITSLKISPNGLFMAVGHSDRRFSLWDLRKLVVRRLFSLSLAFATYNHLSTLLSLSQLDAMLEPSVEYIKTILAYRFRYDIELAPEGFIQTGEFDIELV